MPKKTFSLTRFPLSMSFASMSFAMMGFVILMSFVSLMSLAISPAYANTAKIEVSGANRYKTLRLTPEIYNAANSDLSDLLIKDSKGENVPYFIYSSSKSASESKESYPMELINAYLKDDSFYFDYRLAEKKESDIISTSIEFAAAGASFAKEVELYGSHDDKNWAYILSGTLYSIDGKSKLAIDFPSPQKYTFFRLKLANNLERISFSAVNLIYRVETVENTYFIESFNPSRSVKSADKMTKISIEGLRNLRLLDVTIASDSMFKRNASAPYGISKEIFNLSLNGTTYNDTTIPLGGLAPTDEPFVIAISDGDDKPIQISGVTARYYADEIVFEGVSGEAYTLEFGADPSKAAPVYDIARYKNEILRGALDRASIGPIVYATTRPTRDYKTVFNVVIIIVTLLLGVIITLKLRGGGLDKK